jgi:hypothetical protein
LFSSIQLKTTHFVSATQESVSADMVSLFGQHLKETNHVSLMLDPILFVYFSVNLLIANTCVAKEEGALHYIYEKKKLYGLYSWVDVWLASRV